MTLGDVVRLKSGGPLMTVDGAAPTADYWFCAWFPTKGPQVEIGCRAAFHKDALEIVKTKKGAR